MATPENFLLLQQAVQFITNMRRDMRNNPVWYKAQFDAGVMTIGQVEAAVNGDGVAWNKLIDKIVALSTDSAKKARILDGFTVIDMDEAAVTAVVTELRAAANMAENATINNATQLDNAIAWVTSNVTQEERLF